MHENKILKEPTVQRVGRLFLWINSGCNARCQMCDIWREKPGRQLVAADVRRWAPEWRTLGVGRVILCGESLMHTEVWDVAQAIRDVGIRVELLSNGLLLERHAPAVAAYCDEFRVSLDGPPGVHDAVRGVSRAYERLKRGLVALRREQPDMPVVGRCAVHSMNFRHLRATVTAAHDLGLQGISFSGTDLYNEEAFRRFGTITRDYIDALGIRPEQVADLEQELAALYRDFASDFASGFISDKPEDLDRLLLQYYRGMSGLGPLPAVRCNAPWNSAVLEYDGTVRPCFPMPAYGNIRQTGKLAATINSPKAIAHRRKLDVNTDPMCRRCVCQTFSGT